MLGSLCRAGSLKTVARGLAKYNFDLAVVQEVTWVEGGSQPAEDYIFLHGNGNAKHHSDRLYHIYIYIYIYMGIISEVIKSLWNRRNCHSSGRNLLLYLFIRRAIKLTTVITDEYHCYQIHTKFCIQYSCLKVNSICR